MADEADKAFNINNCASVSFDTEGGSGGSAHTNPFTVDWREYGTKPAQVARTGVTYPAGSHSGIMPGSKSSAANHGWFDSKTSFAATRIYGSTDIHAKVAESFIVQAAGAGTVTGGQKVTAPGWPTSTHILYQGWNIYNAPCDINAFALMLVATGQHTKVLEQRSAGGRITEIVFLDVMRLARTAFNEGALSQSLHERLARLGSPGRWKLANVLKAVAECGSYGPMPTDYTKPDPATALQLHEAMADAIAVEYVAQAVRQDVQQNKPSLLGLVSEGGLVRYDYPISLCHLVRAKLWRMHNLMAEGKPWDAECRDFAAIIWWDLPTGARHAWKANLKSSNGYTQRLADADRSRADAKSFVQLLDNYCPMPSKKEVKEGWAPHEDLIYTLIPILKEHGNQLLLEAELGAAHYPSGFLHHMPSGGKVHWVNNP